MMQRYRLQLPRCRTSSLAWKTIRSMPLVCLALYARRALTIISRNEQNYEHITEIDDLLFLDIVDLWQFYGFLGAERNVE
jgi:hypothetical protein